MGNPARGEGAKIVRLEPRQLGLGEIFFRTRDAVVVGEADSGRIVLWNPAAAAMFGYDESEALGMQVEQLVPAALKDRHRAGLARYARQGSGDLIDSGAPVELPAVDREGREIWVEMSLTPIEATTLPGRYAMAIVRDVSERKRLESELRRAHDELEVTVDQLRRRTTELTLMNELGDLLQSRTTELTLMNELGDLLQSCATIDEAAEIIGQMARRLFPSHTGALHLFAPSRNILDAIVKWGAEPPDRQAIEPAACWALRRGRPHLVDEPGATVACRHADVGYSTLCVPMSAHGDTIGLLHLRADSDGDVGAVRDLAVAVGEHVALALANFRLRETLEHQSIRDPLTNLYNRRYMEESLDREVRRAVRHHLALAVIAIDVDQFKTYNDSFGHDAGDLVLKMVGRFLHDHIRSEDIACRHGGDEFLLILPYASLSEAVRRAAELNVGVRLLSLDRAPARFLTLSLGVAALPEHGDSAPALLAAADDALYRAKRKGRDRVELAHPPG